MERKETTDIIDSDTRLPVFCYLFFASGILNIMLLIVVIILLFILMP
nr:MAG TPA: hypothetical protein [Caudoviricetes sp.]